MINNLKEPLRYDEFRSDEFAARILKEKMNVKKPSLVADNALKAVKKQFEGSGENSDLGNKPPYLRLCQLSPNQCGACCKHRQ